MTNSTDIALAVISALLGGSGLKMLEVWWNRAKYKNETQKQARDELREESNSLHVQVSKLKEEIKVAEEEADKWRSQYWNIYTEFTKFQLEVRKLLIDSGIDPLNVFPDPKRAN